MEPSLTLFENLFCFLFLLGTARSSANPVGCVCEREGPLRACVCKGLRLTIHPPEVRAVELWRWLDDLSLPLSFPFPRSGRLLGVGRISREESETAPKGFCITRPPVPPLTLQHAAAHPPHALHDARLAVLSRHLHRDGGGWGTSAAPPCCG